MMNQGQLPMKDKDWIQAVLTYEKHVVQEYATAVTESNCATVRQMFTSLLNDTLRSQEDVFHLMSQHGWYDNPAKAIRQEVEKELQTYHQTQQEMNLTLSQQRQSSAIHQPGYTPTQYPGAIQPPPTQFARNMHQH